MISKVLSSSLIDEGVFQQPINTLLESLISNRADTAMLSKLVSDTLSVMPAGPEKETIKADIVYALGELQKTKDGISESRLMRYISMILRTALKKLPAIRKDEMIPAKTKELMTREIVFGSFVKMAAVKYSQEFEELIVEFEQISEEIGKELVRRNDDRGRHWNVRDSALWDWCRVLIEDTAHPSFFWLKETEDNAGQKHAVQQFHKLFEALVKTVMWVSFPDDMADNYKHVRLTELFNSIPFASDATLKALREEVSGIDNGLFTRYFDHAVKVWKSAEADFRVIIGKEYDKHIHRLKENYKWIKRAMEFSAKMNADPSRSYPLTNIAEHLQHSMMATSFNTLQNMLCLELQNSDAPLRLINSFEDSTFESLMRQAQENARRSNNISTVRKALFEGVFSNILISKITEWYDQHNTDKSKYLTEKGTCIVRLQGILWAHRNVTSRDGVKILETPKKDINFCDLLVFRLKIEKALYEEYKKLDADQNLLKFQKDYPKAIQKIEESLDAESLVHIEKIKKALEDLGKLILDIANESNVFRIYYREWEDCRRAMIDNVASYYNNLSTLQGYIKGWDRVHITYLAMKYERIF